MSPRRMGFLIPEFPQQTHIAWWRISEGMKAAGSEVHLLSTRRPRSFCPHLQLREAASTTTYLWPPSVGTARELTNGLARLGPVFRYIVALEDATGWGRFKLLALAAAAMQLKRTSQAKGLEHVFVHSCADAAHVVALAQRMGGPSYTLRLGGDLEVYGGDHKAKMKNATLVVPAARAYEERLVEEIGVERHRIMWTWVGTDTDRFSPVASQRPQRSFSITTVARLNPSKGFQFMIPALRLLRSEGIDFHYRIVGAGPSEHDIRRMLKSEGLGDRVTLEGSRSADDIIAILRESDVFVLPTSGKGEGTPAVVCEAMGVGLPVVATHVGGLPDMLASGEHGYLVPPGNSEELARALKRLAKDTAMRTRLARNARARATEEFDYRIVARRILMRISELACDRVKTETGARLT